MPQRGAAQWIVYSLFDHRAEIVFIGDLNAVKREIARIREFEQDGGYKHESFFARRFQLGVNFVVDGADGPIGLDAKPPGNFIEFRDDAGNTIPDAASISDASLIRQMAIAALLEGADTASFEAELTPNLTVE